MRAISGTYGTYRIIDVLLHYYIMYIGLCCMFTCLRSAISIRETDHKSNEWFIVYCIRVSLVYANVVQIFIARATFITCLVRA